MRSLSALTRHAVAVKVASASGVKFSSCGPGMKRSGPSSCAKTGAATSSPSAAAQRNRSPATSARPSIPPNFPRKNVERLPRTSGKSSPPEKPRQAGPRVSRKASTSPDCRTSPRQPVTLCWLPSARVSTPDNSPARPTRRGPCSTRKTRGGEQDFQPCRVFRRARQRVGGGELKGVERAAERHAERAIFGSPAILRGDAQSRLFDFDARDHDDSRNTIGRKILRPLSLPAARKSRGRSGASAACRPASARRGVRDCSGRTEGPACVRSAASRRGCRADRRRTCHRRWRPSGQARVFAVWPVAGRQGVRQAAEIGEAGLEAEHGDLENLRRETLELHWSGVRFFSAADLGEVGRKIDVAAKGNVRKTRPRFFSARRLPQQRRERRPPARRKRSGRDRTRG